MNSFCDKCKNERIYDCSEYELKCIYDCEKFKRKSDELYDQAKYLQEISQNLICEAKKLEQDARDLDKEHKQICSKINIVWEEVYKLNLEVNSLFNLANFYYQKVAECRKYNAQAMYDSKCDSSCNKDNSCNC